MKNLKKLALVGALRALRRRIFGCRSDILRR